MASSSLTSKPFLGSASRTERLSGLCSDLRNLSSPSKKLQVQAAGSTFGNYFCVTTYGESHGGGVGCVIDGVPPRRPLSEADLQPDLDRRRPGQSQITTPRNETDTCKILSGVQGGTPIHVFVQDYDEM